MDGGVDGSQTGNSASTTTDDTVHFDDVAPTVSIASAVPARPTRPTARSPSTRNSTRQVASFDFSNVTFTSAGPDRHGDRFRHPGPSTRPSTTSRSPAA